MVKIVEKRFAGTNPITVELTGFLKHVNIVARDLDEAWFLSLKACLDYSWEYKIDKGSFEGENRKEFDFYTLRVVNPSTRPIVPQTPTGVPPPSSADYISQYLPYLMASEKAENEQYTYGEDVEPHWRY